MDTKIVLGYLAFGTGGIVAGMWLSKRQKARVLNQPVSIAPPPPVVNTGSKLALEDGGKKSLTMEEAMLQAADGINTNRGRMKIKVKRRGRQSIDDWDEWS